MGARRTFLNFLRGMETFFDNKCLIKLHHFLNFLRGMETVEAVPVLWG